MSGNKLVIWGRQDVAQLWSQGGWMETWRQEMRFCLQRELIPYTGMGMVALCIENKATGARFDVS